MVHEDIPNHSQMVVLSGLKSSFHVQMTPKNRTHIFLQAIKKDSAMQQI